MFHGATHMHFPVTMHLLTRFISPVIPAKEKMTKALPEIGRTHKY